MKKIVTILTALAIALSANAQTRFGLKAGLNVSQTGGGTIKANGQYVDTEASDMLVGFHAGGYANFSFNPVIGLQPEVVFSLQGEKETVETASSKAYLGYINVPILLDIKPTPNFSILVGPQVGINVFKRMSIAGESISGSEMDDLLALAGMKVNIADIAAVLGVQYVILDHLTIGARYNFGFTSTVGLTKEGKDVGLSISGGGNRVIQVSIGWTF